MGTESETIEQPQLLNTKFPELNNIKIRRVCAGFDHTLFVTEDNKVYALGRGDSGQLGMGAKVTLATKPTLISSLVTQHIDIKDACCGGHHSLILSGSVYLSLTENHDKN
jgi:alpha-tubulin suppressor-like RCC1 family protein